MIINPRLLGYLEVHPTPVSSRLGLLDVLHPELCRTGAELEVSPGPELCVVAPASPQVPRAVAGVVTGENKILVFQDHFVGLNDPN